MCLESCLVPVQKLADIILWADNALGSGVGGVFRRRLITGKRSDGRWHPSNQRDTHVGPREVPIKGTGRKESESSRHMSNYYFHDMNMEFRGQHSTSYSVPPIKVNEMGVPVT